MLLKIIFWIMGIIGFILIPDDNEDTARWGWILMIIAIISLCYIYGWQEYPDDAILH